jgi:hypothetical protein
MAKRPWKLSSAFVSLIDRSHVLPIPLLCAAIAHSLDDMPVALFAFVVPLDHKVWQVRDERATEPAGSGGEIDKLLVLRPFGFRCENGFLRFTREDSGEGVRISE